MKLIKLFLIISLVFSMANLVAADKPVKPVVATEPSGMNADDPAIWIHPTDKSKSLIAGLDKSDGIKIYDQKGKILQSIDPYGKINNVDTSYNFLLGGKKVDIFVANIRKTKYTRDEGRLVVMVINPDYGKKQDPVTVIADGQSKDNLITPDSYGMGLYRSPKTGKTYIFEAGKGKGKIRQSLIEDDGTGKGVKVSAVRYLDYDGDTWEGCVVDDVAGHVYIPEENKGIFKYYAEPGEPTTPFYFFDHESFIKDREGSALYKLNDGTGYYIISNQGNAATNIPPSFVIFTREKENKFVKQVYFVDPKGESSQIETDGLDVTAVGTPQFPNGFLVAHNSGDSNFLIYDWKDIAGKDLKVKPEIAERE